MWRRGCIQLRERDVVIDLGEVEPTWRGQCAATLMISRLQRGLHIVARPAPLADQLQRADNGPNLIVQETYLI